jgi:HAE1 family hydrophobic/amphiphilic exporter-1
MPRPLLLVFCALVVMSTGVGHAADTQEPRTWWGAKELPRQWRPTEPESDAVKVPDEITDDENIEPVSLKQAIAIALENNPRIAAQRLEPAKQEAGILGAQAQYDPTIAAEVRSASARTPNQSILAATDTLVVDERSANAHLIKRLRTSTLLQADFLNERIDNNASFNQLRPAYQPALNFSVIQPLLRDFGWDFSYLVVRVAEQTADAARFQYEANLADFVAEVIVAYWAVVQTRENLEVQRESLSLAERTVSENEARVRVGLLAPVAVLEARADAKAREEDVIIAENNLVVARQRLGQLAYYRPDATFIPRTLEPTEEAEPEQVSADLESTVANAVNDRPEVRASARGVQVTVLNERIAGNALLPRVDLVGSYGLNGLSGLSRPVITERNIPGGGCVQIGANPPSFSCNSPYGGPASDAYDRMVTNEFRSYTFGVQVQVPIANAAARSDYTQSRINRSQAELNHRALLSQITFDARASVADVVSTRQRIDTSRVARELAEENLRNQEKRHEVGLATTKDLLDFQTRLTSARAAEVQAKTDYAISVARWRRAQGRLLSHYQIVLDEAGKRTTPWFARF